MFFQKCIPSAAGDIQWDKLCSSQGGDETFCNSNVSPVINNFMWQACCNILPTRANLKKGICYARIIMSNTGARLENYRTFFLWECPSAKDAWGICSKQTQNCSLEDLSFLDIFMTLSVKLEAEVEQMIVIARDL